MSSPKISVVLPVFNGGEYLREAIQSVLNQTYKNFELIIIDDGSTDNSLEIARLTQISDFRVRLITRENRGLVASLSEGISLARGKFIARMDADDLSIETRFEEQIKLLECGYDICGSNYHEIDESGQIIRSKHVPISDSEVLITLARTVPFAHGSVMFRKEAYVSQVRKYGDTKFFKAEDYALWCDMYLNAVRFANVDKFLFKYRNIEGTLTSNPLHKVHSARISIDYMMRNRARILDNITCRHNRTEEISLIQNYLIVYFLFLDFDFSLFKRLSKTRGSTLLKALKLYFSTMYFSRRKIDE